jgi:hypothetical protein
MSDTSEVLEKAQVTLASLQNQLAQLRSENRYLRSKTAGKYDMKHLGQTGRILRRALDDATVILAMQVSGYKPSRAFCLDLGMSERRFFWAVGLLRSARVMEDNTFLEMDFQTAESKLKGRYAFLKARPDALDLLRLRMPRKMAKAVTS